MARLDRARAHPGGARTGTTTLGKEEGMREIRIVLDEDDPGMITLTTDTGYHGHGVGYDRGDRAGILGAVAEIIFCGFFDEPKEDS